MKIRNALSATFSRFAHSKALLVFVLSICCLPGKVYAGAHCFGTLGPPSSPIKNFGELATYGTQIGHDSDCRNRSNGASDLYMSNSSNHASACNAAKGASIVTYWSVGTKKYQTGNTYACPQTNSGPQRGSIVFPDTNARTNWNRTVYVNDTELSSPDVFAPTNFKSPFVTFQLIDRLGFHMQRWTYDATLYRDNVLVERLSGLSPGVAAPGVSVIFTSQPANFVHGHTWTITWHYTGNGPADGSTHFFIP